MPSGFFLGGLAQGFQDQSRITAAQNYQSGLLKLEQQRLQQQADREIQQQIDKHQELLFKTIDDVKVAHNGPHDPKALYQSQAANIEGIASLIRQTKGPEAEALFRAQVAAQVAAPSSVDVGSATARAKAEATGERQKNIAIGKSYPDLTPEQGDAIYNDKNLTPGQRTGLEPLPQGYKVAQSAQPDVATEQQQYGGTKYIKTPFTARQKAIIGYAGATPEQFDFDATMYAYGNTNVTQGYRSYHGVNPVTVMRARAAQYWMDKFPGEMGPQQANAVMTEFKAMQHGANTAASIDARMTAALAKAQNTAKILTGPGGQDLINKVDRTQYKDLNDFLVNWRGRTGNTPEIRLAIALETLASNYGVSLGMGNSILTDVQTKRAQDMLQKGWSTGQLQAAVDQMTIEMQREEAGTRQGISTFIGGMQSTMEKTMGGQGSRVPPPPSGFILGQ